MGLYATFYVPFSGGVWKTQTSDHENAETSKTPTPKSDRLSDRYDLILGIEIFS